ncbi:hypothetical protein HPB50_016817 [Hyalomma asiaticum]|uniref:Uncharacterized protein n=1 Tax=Hyalomma asiaticum TaxID=266040 RepID=A0ACB7TNV0_HYAAI|nr:hypothetical protein HPB50_016817 [Hyalomma asiaticum]
MAPTNGQSQVDRPVMPRTDQVMSVINREGMVVLQAVRGGGLFCTVGISMRHVQYNLRKPSHVIIDGVHERHVCTDLHLPVHGGPLAVNSTTKVILMSATINTMLSKNFGGDPVHKIPGRTHRSPCLFLEDLISEGLVTKLSQWKCVPTTESKRGLTS